jgi:hypothetical protein
MLFLDAVHVERPDGSLRFRWVKAPTSAELTQLTQTLARRISRYLATGLAYPGCREQLSRRRRARSRSDGTAPGFVDHLPHRHRAATRSQGVHPQMLPACDQRFDDGVGKVVGFSLHAGVATRADQRQKLERFCRYISRPAFSE